MFNFTREPTVQLRSEVIKIWIILHSGDITLTSAVYCMCWYNPPSSTVVQSFWFSHKDISKNNPSQSVVCYIWTNAKSLVWTFTLFIATGLFLLSCKQQSPLNMTKGKKIYTSWKKFKCAINRTTQYLSTRHLWQGLHAPLNEDFLISSHIFVDFMLTITYAWLTYIHRSVTTLKLLLTDETQLKAPSVNPASELPRSQSDEASMRWPATCRGPVITELNIGLRWSELMLHEHFYLTTEFVRVL